MAWRRLLKEYNPSEIGNMVSEFRELVTTVFEKNADITVELGKLGDAMTRYQKHCTPGFYNAEGKLSGGGFFDATYPGGAVRFNRMLAKWRDQGDLEGMSIT